MKLGAQVRAARAASSAALAAPLVSATVNFSDPRISRFGGGRRSLDSRPCHGRVSIGRRDRCRWRHAKVRPRKDPVARHRCAEVPAALRRRLAGRIYRSWPITSPAWRSARRKGASTARQAGAHRGGGSNGLARKCGITVVEDAAKSLGSFYHGRRLGVRS
jgi:hypothetical protein